MDAAHEFRGNIGVALMAGGETATIIVHACQLAADAAPSGEASQRRLGGGISAPRPGSSRTAGLAGDRRFDPGKTQRGSRDPQGIAGHRDGAALDEGGVAGRAL